MIAIAIAAMTVLATAAPARADHSRLEVVISRDVRDGDPVGSGLAFTGTDPQACIHLTLFELSTSHTIRFEVSRPNGSTYGTLESKTQAAGPGRVFHRYRTWYCLPIAEHEPAFTVGDWKVKVLIDGRVIKESVFQILGVGASGVDKIRVRLQAMKARVDANPTDPLSRLDLAEALIDLNEFDAAVAQLRRALELDPQLARAHALLGYVHLRQGQLDEAERSLREAVRLRGDDPWAHYQLGQVYKEKGDTARAIEHFRRVVQIEGDTTLRKAAKEELAKLGVAP